MYDTKIVSKCYSYNRIWLKYEFIVIDFVSNMQNPELNLHITNVSIVM